MRGNHIKKEKCWRALSEEIGLPHQTLYTYYRLGKIPHWREFTPEMVALMKAAVLNRKDNKHYEYIKPKAFTPIF